MSWTATINVRDLRTFRNGEYVMTVFPSLQDDLYHVIIENEFCVTINNLMTKDAIENVYGIKL
jgi:hypothetical protein